MLHFLLLPDILKTLWSERIALFWPIWIAITASSVVLVIWFVPQGESIRLESIRSRRHDWSRAAVLAVVFLALFLACYIAGSLVWEDFAYRDNSMFTLGTLAGHDFARAIYPSQGRFFPLGNQEFNSLRHVTRSVTGYHALRIVEIVLLSGILLVLDEQLSIRVRVALVTLTLITPSILISFSGLIYPEANVLFWLVCVVWSVKRFEQTHFIPWAVAAVISSQFMLYYKETAFLLLLGFAVGRLLLRCWRADRSGWDFKRLRDPESRLDMCLTFLAVAYLLFYLAVMFPNYGARYADDWRFSPKRVFTSYVKLDLLAWVLVAVVLVRIVLILRRRVAPALLWDALALAGMGCFAGYLSLRMFTAYYLAPVDLIAVLYLGRLAALSVKSMGLGTRLFALALLSVVLLQDFSLSAFRMYERKNLIHAKAEIGRVIKARYESNPQNAKRLFFPLSDPYTIMEFSAYLSYLGVPVEGVYAGSVATGSIMIVGPSIKKDAPCVNYQAVECHPGSSPDPGDLIIVLPDDYLTTEELNSYQQEGMETLLSYQPHPQIPQWLRPYVHRLLVVSSEFPRSSLPDHWLSASVIIAK
jgi:hypothetical protein